MSNVTDINLNKGKNQADEAREFLENYVNSLSKIPKDDIANILSMVLADLTRTVLIDFHRHFCKKPNRLRGDAVLQIVIENLVAYTTHLHEQLIPDESESKH